VFCYNSAESEPVWMKYGTLWVHWQILGVIHAVATVWEAGEILLFFVR